MEHERFIEDGDDGGEAARAVEHLLCEDVRMSCAEEVEEVAACDAVAEERGHLLKSFALFREYRGKDGLQVAVVSVNGAHF